MIASNAPPNLTQVARSGCGVLTCGALINALILHFATLYIIEIGWICFAAIFLFRRRAARNKTKTTNWNSIFGVVIQTASLFTVWSIGRRSRMSIFAGTVGFELALFAIVLILVAGSLYIMWTAVRTLGKQWSLQARVLENHALIRTGPYRLVRHPIYTGILGMILAAALTWSNWLGFIVSISLYVVGTIIRVRSEEKLLRAQFGDAFEDYKREVPAVIPLRFRRG
jgi:protein-S-isoprenylcysteine O-methyltransferase Ste14